MITINSIFSWDTTTDKIQIIIRHISFLISADTNAYWISARAHTHYYYKYLSKFTSKMNLEYGWHSALKVSEYSKLLTSCLFSYNPVFKAHLGASCLFGKCIFKINDYFVIFSKCH